MSGITFNGDNINNGSLLKSSQACLEQCQANTDCVAWNYIAKWDIPECWLHGAGATQASETVMGEDAGTYDPTPLYKCVQGKCVENNASDPVGMPLEQCDNFCLSPTDKYLCAGQATASVLSLLTPLVEKTCRPACWTASSMHLRVRFRLSVRWSVTLTSLRAPAATMCAYTGVTLTGQFTTGIQRALEATSILEKVGQGRLTKAKCMETPQCSSQMTCTASVCQTHFRDFSFFASF
jgi:hypothetical protein